MFAEVVFNWLSIRDFLGLDSTANITHGFVGDAMAKSPILCVPNKTLKKHKLNKFYFWLLKRKYRARIFEVYCDDDNVMRSNLPLLEAVIKYQIEISIFGLPLKCFYSETSTEELAQFVELVKVSNLNNIYFLLLRHECTLDDLQQVLKYISASSNSKLSIYSAKVSLLFDKTMRKLVMEARDDVVNWLPAMFLIISNHVDSIDISTKIGSYSFCIVAHVDQFISTIEWLQGETFEDDACEKLLVLFKDCVRMRYIRRAEWRQGRDAASCDFADRSLRCSVVSPVVSAVIAAYPNLKVAELSCPSCEQLTTLASAHGHTIEHLVIESLDRGELNHSMAVRLPHLTHLHVHSSYRMLDAAVVTAWNKLEMFDVVAELTLEMAKALSVAVLSLTWRFRGCLRKLLSSPTYKRRWSSRMASLLLRWATIRYG